MTARFRTTIRSRFLPTPSVFSRACLAALMVAAAATVMSGGGVCGQNVGREEGDGPSPTGAPTGTPAAPALFVFGDSLIDNGNNNALASFAKANYYPYGIDFSAGPTGRFSNGFTMVDEIARLLGLPLTPPYSRATAEQSLEGVNYASAAAGILDDTGRNFVGRIPFDQQIRNFEATVRGIVGSAGGEEAAAEGLGRSIFFVGMGSNDYLNNYLLPNYDTRDRYNPQEFADLLVQQYSRQLGRLYDLGGRRIALAGLGLMGCIPSIRAQSGDGECSDEATRLVEPFNSNMKAMVSDLNARLPAARFVYIDIFRTFQDLLSDSQGHGLTVVNRGCCGVGRNQGQITCLPMQTPCPNRDEYVYWDAFHPTQAVNVILARKSFNGDTTYVRPINIQQLAAL